MPLYIYEAFSRDGKTTRGQMDADSTASVRKHLAGQGLYPKFIEVATTGKSTGFSIRNLFQRSVSMKDKILFTKQMTVLLRSGIPLVETLDLLTDQFSGKLRRIIIDIKDRVKEGGTLASGFEQYPRVFEKVYVQLVRAGEASGKLEFIMERLTTYLERRQEVTRRVKSAMREPIIQLGVVFGVVVVLLVFVIPKLMEIFISQGAELPLATRILIGLSDFATSYYWLVGIVGFGSYILFKWWKASPQGSVTFDRIKLYIPVVGSFTRMSAVVQFSRTLGMLLESGVNLSDALNIVCNIIDNKVLAKELNEAREQIIKQGRIAQYLEKTNLFPPFAIYLIRTGEQSGALDTMLLTIAQNQEADLTEMSDNLSKNLQPAMMLVMAVVVGFVALAIMQPIMQMNQAIGM